MGKKTTPTREELKRKGGWLSLPLSKTEKRRLEYWFDRSKKEIIGDETDPDTSERRWDLLMTRMETEFPRYKVLQNTKYQQTPHYRSLRRCFSRMASKWEEESPAKFRRSPRRSQSQASTTATVKDGSPSKASKNGEKENGLK